MCTGTWVGGGLYGVDAKGDKTLIQAGGEVGGSYSWDNDYDVSAYEYLTGSCSAAGSMTLVFSNPR